MEQTTIINIEGMSCGHCAQAVKGLIEEVEGVSQVTVVLAQNEASVSFDANTTDAQTIIENINSSNAYKATQK